MCLGRKSDLRPITLDPAMIVNWLKGYNVLIAQALLRDLGSGPTNVVAADAQVGLTTMPWRCGMGDRFWLSVHKLSVSSATFPRLWDEHAWMTDAP